MKICKENVENIVDITLQRIKEQVEEKGFPLSSEKTLVFKFMWELAMLVQNDDLKFDFEYIAYSGKDRFLDLLVWTDDAYKVAFEFKLPKRGQLGTGSDSTNKKIKIYRDIARVKSLVDKSTYNICAGFFILAVNEDSYLNKGRADPTYSVCHEHISTESVVDGMPLPESLVFNWNSIKWSHQDSKWLRDGKFAWLEPIKIIT